jgi:predicted PurR-regulated permease PerM
MSAMVRMSIRQLLLFVAIIAIAIVSLNFANELWMTSIIGATMLVVVGAAIVGVVDRGPRQAYAAGFAITAVLYLLFLGALFGREFEQLYGKLPTTWSLTRLHKAINRNVYFDNIGRVIPNYVPADNSAGYGVGGFAIQTREIPQSGHFMPIGHCWWAILLGCIGGLFARFIYARRVREQPNRAADFS